MVAAPVAAASVESISGVSGYPLAAYHAFFCPSVVAGGRVCRQDRSAPGRFERPTQGLGNRPGAVHHVPPSVSACTNRRYRRPSCACCITTYRLGSGQRRGQKSPRPRRFPRLCHWCPGSVNSRKACPVEEEPLRQAREVVASYTARLYSRF
jgi:hypothetical protein